MIIRYTHDSIITTAPTLEETIAQRKVSNAFARDTIGSTRIEGTAILVAEAFHARTITPAKRSLGSIGESRASAGDGSCRGSSDT